MTLLSLEMICDLDIVPRFFKVSLASALFFSTVLYCTESRNPSDFSPKYPGNADGIVGLQWAIRIPFVAH